MKLNANSSFLQANDDEPNDDGDLEVKIRQAGTMLDFPARTP